MRRFPSTGTQFQAHRLRNEFCRLGSPTEMAQVSAHLRNYAVAETIGLVGTLDSHPRVIGVPTLAKAPAAFQQAKGTAANPFTHVQRVEILDAQIRAFENDVPNLRDATKSVLAATSGEQWK